MQTPYAGGLISVCADLSLGENPKNSNIYNQPFDPEYDITPENAGCVDPVSNDAFGILFLSASDYDLCANGVGWPGGGNANTIQECINNATEPYQYIQVNGYKANAIGAVFGGFISNVGDIVGFGLIKILVILACLTGLGILTYYFSRNVGGRGFVAGRLHGSDNIFFVGKDGRAKKYNIRSKTTSIL